MKTRQYTHKYKHINCQVYIWRNPNKVCVWGGGPRPVWQVTHKHAGHTHRLGLNNQAPSISTNSHRLPGQAPSPWKPSLFSKPVLLCLVLRFSRRITFNKDQWANAKAKKTGETDRREKERQEVESVLRVSKNPMNDLVPPKHRLLQM